MKTLSKILIIGGIAMIPGGARAVVGDLIDTPTLLTCQTLSNCSLNTTTDFPCCCKTGETGTTYECPTGWTWSTAKALCQRASTTGTDTKGTYTQTYGTCSYSSTSTYDCYTPSSSTATNPDGTACRCTTN